MRANRLAKAVTFASEKHWGQMYGKKPYVYHLQAVYDVCLRFNLPMHVGVAAILHDVLEDTDADYVDIMIMFGRNIASLVYVDIRTKGPGIRR